MAARWAGCRAGASFGGFSSKQQPIQGKHNLPCFLSDGGTEALKAGLALIDRVEAHPAAVPGGKPRIELLGELTMMLRFACGAQKDDPYLNSL